MAQEISQTSPLTASCFCHTLALTITAPPISSYICHCTDCRRATGSSFAHNASFAEEAVSIHLSSNSEVCVGAGMAVGDGRKGGKAGDGAEGKKGGGESGEGKRGEKGKVSTPKEDEQSTSEARLKGVMSMLGDKISGGVLLCACCGSKMILYVPARVTSMQGKVIVPVGVIDGSETNERLRPRMEGYVGRREAWMGKMEGTGECEMW